MRSFALAIALISLLSLQGINSHGDHEHVDLPRDPPGFRPLLAGFQLNEVMLSPGSPAYEGQMLNKDYLHMLDVDRLLYTFRANANLSTLGAQPLGGWEAPDCEIRGHFVAMYLSASAHAYQAYGDVKQKKIGDYMVTVMAQVQEALNESGYLMAFPSTTFDRMEEMSEPLPWAPYYVLHKVLQGLYDMHTLAGNQQAWSMLIKLVDYFYNRMQNLVAKYTIYRWELMLMNSPWTEFGGMNEVMYIIYAKTRDPRHLWMAAMFDDATFMGPLAFDEDWLTMVHANSHIPIVLGSAMRYQLFGEKKYGEVAENFWQMVYYNHSYATGGSNGGNGSFDAINERWGWPDRLSLTLTNNNQEFCTTYNMLKVVRYLITWHGQVEHMDHYERAYFNGVLGTQRVSAGPGVMLYNYPLATGFTKAQSHYGWGSPYESFWCCYATAIDQWTTMGSSIYFQTLDRNALYVNLFVPSVLTWTLRNITVTQRTNFPVQQGSSFLINVPNNGTSTFSLKIRIPYWITPGGTIYINGRRHNESLVPATMATIDRTWKDGDLVTIDLPFNIHAHVMNDDPRMFAIMYGPIVLAGVTNETQILPITSLTQLNSIITPVQGEDFAFNVLIDNGQSKMLLLPIYDNEILEVAYGIYWLLSN